jgi:hypothetical protein
MALHFRRSNALLLLVPKTGTTWIRDMGSRSGLEVASVGDPVFECHDPLGFFDRSAYRFIGAFVRSPISWYRSYWAYRRERGWQRQYPLDRHCASEDFEAFIRRAVTILPGALDKIFALYVGPKEGPIDFIGRQESLAEDFRRFLHLAGEDVDTAALAPVHRVNATSARRDYAEELKELITLSEWETMERFGYTADRADPMDYAEMRARYPEDADDLRLLALWTQKLSWEAGEPCESRHALGHRSFAQFAGGKHGHMDYAAKRLAKASASLRTSPEHNPRKETML